MWVTKHTIVHTCESVELQFLNGGREILDCIVSNMQLLQFAQPANVKWQSPQSKSRDKTVIINRVEKDG